MFYNPRPSDGKSVWQKVHIQKKWLAKNDKPLPGHPERFLCFETQGRKGDKCFVPGWILEEARRKHRDGNEVLPGEGSSYVYEV
ncbi:hypothetical protein VKT23_019201 [Stygiomarasmius scandens]|uniref:Uncharacterized protein n=1 Tax=Marasmiellus scandens TaxID=2682957 RepID=A0ABR1IM95_9AGAR